MKNITGGLLAFLLNTPNCVKADLFTITAPLLNNAVIRATSGQGDITFGGNLFQASGVNVGSWTRGQIKLSLGLTTDTMDLSVTADTTVLIGGIPLIQAIRIGLLEGAIVRVETLYFTSSTYGDGSLGSEIKFIGEMSEVKSVGRTLASVIVKSLLHRLDTQLPKRIIQPGCSNTLFDPQCGLTKASFATSKIVLAGSTQLVITPSVAFSQADGYFSLGTMTLTSGANSGITATIKLHTGGVIVLNKPLPFTLNAGDTFTVYPGCDKLQATCSGKFSNIANFEGEPYVPVPETAI